MLKHGNDFGQVQVMAISMAFAKKMMEFPSDLVSFSTKLSSKRHDKIHVTVFTELLSLSLSPVLRPCGIKREKAGGWRNGKETLYYNTECGSTEKGIESTIKEKVKMGGHATD